MAAGRYYFVRAQTVSPVLVSPPPALSTAFLWAGRLAVSSHHSKTALAEAYIFPCVCQAKKLSVSSNNDPSVESNLLRLGWLQVMSHSQISHDGRRRNLGPRCVFSSWSQAKSALSVTPGLRRGAIVSRKQNAVLCSKEGVEGAKQVSTAAGKE